MSNKYNRFESFKVLAHAEKIKEILADKIPSPVQWVIYPSNVCGYRCGHCIMAREQTDHRNTLSETAMRRIPIDAKKHEIKSILFSGGGDPLLNRWTETVAKELKENGNTVGLDNQGYNLKDPSSFSYIRFSVDAANRETYEKIHRVDGWERINTNIHKAIQERNNNGKLEIGLAFLVTPLNWTETWEFCVWAEQFNPDFVHIRPAYLDADYLDREYPGGGKAIKDVIVPNLLEMSKKITVTWPNVHFKLDKFEGFWTPKLYDKCRATPLMAVTSGDGAFLVCKDRGTSKDEEYLRWGNYNIQNFEDIWWSEEHKNVLKGIDLERCPRCIMNPHNEIVQNVFIEDKMRLALI